VKSKRPVVNEWRPDERGESGQEFFGFGSKWGTILKVYLAALFSLQDLNYNSPSQKILRVSLTSQIP
jgi:hypothetical protein